VFGLNSQNDSTCVFDKIKRNLKLQLFWIFHFQQWKKICFHIFQLLLKCWFVPKRYVIKWVFP